MSHGFGFVLRDLGFDSDGLDDTIHRASQDISVPPLYPITIGFVTSELIDQRVIQAGKGEVELQERVSGGAFDGLISTPAGVGAE